MEILAYQDWMKPQVIKMFVEEYGVEESAFELLFTHFYESEFQRERCIRIAAVEGEKVGGFQSFFYWPLTHHGKTVDAWQSGNSLVHPDFRGKGLFSKMLDFIHQPDSGFNAELLIGFPVEMSYNSFIRNNWINPFNLQWYVKMGNPILSLFRIGSTSIPEIFRRDKQEDFNSNDPCYRVAQSVAFDNYRFGYQKDSIGRLQITENDQSIFLEFKIQIRKKIIRELVVGKVLFSSNDEYLNVKLFKKALQKITRALRPSIFSFAYNEHHSSWMRILDENGFKKHEKKIHFIAKGKIATSIIDWKVWDIQRGDIDTW
jgi:GNAT superfamily N-acetyltransferase